MSEVSPVQEILKRERYDRERVNLLRYRSKKSREWQKWSCWTVGLEYTLLALISVKKEIFRSWRLRFNEKINEETFMYLGSMRLYTCTTGFDKINVRNYCKFMIENKMRVTTFHRKLFVILSLRSLEKMGFLIATSYDRKWPKAYVMTTRARYLLTEFDVAMKRFFDAPLVVPPERYGRRIKVTPKKVQRYRVSILKRGKVSWKYCDNAERAELLQEEGIRQGIESKIYKKTKKKYVEYENKERNRESIKSTEGIQ